MTKYLILILGLSALLLLHGCGTVPESAQPAAESRAETMKPPEMEPPKAVSQPAVIYRATDTGFKWVTDTSDLKSRHRFRLGRRVIEVNSATRYYGGSVADIDVGTRLRAEGVYRDDVIVADAIYFDQPAAPEEPATEAKPELTDCMESSFACASMIMRRGVSTPHMAGTRPLLLSIDLAQAEIARIRMGEIPSTTAAVGIIAQLAVSVMGVTRSASSSSQIRTFSV